jgi:hypothetical protein
MTFWKRQGLLMNPNRLLTRKNNIKLTSVFEYLMCPGCPATLMLFTCINSLGKRKKRPHSENGAVRWWIGKFRDILVIYCSLEKWSTSQVQAFKIQIGTVYYVRGWGQKEKIQENLQNAYKNWYSDGFSQTTKNNLEGA